MQGSRPVLVAVTNPHDRDRIVSVLVRSGAHTQESVEGLDAWNRFRTAQPNLVVAAHDLRGLDGLTLLHRIRQSSNTTFVLQIGSPVDSALAVAAIRSGADDVLNIPGDPETLNERIANLQRFLVNLDPKEKLRRAIEGRSSAIHRLRERIEALSALRVPVLVRGEEGSGRNHVVRCLAIASGTQEAAIMRVAAETPLVRSGLRTGSILYLDEIEDHPIAEQEFYCDLIRSTERGTTDAPVRVVASTKSSLQGPSEDAAFSPRLAALLSRFLIEVPPLRERRTDIGAIAEAMSRSYSIRMRRERVAISPAAMRELQRQPWPGNVRELSEVVERLVAFSTTGVVSRRLTIDVLAQNRAGIEHLRRETQRRQRDELIALLDSTGGNFAEAARRIGMSRGAIIYRARKFGLLVKRGRTI